MQSIIIEIRVEEWLPRKLLHVKSHSSLLRSNVEAGKMTMQIHLPIRMKVRINSK